MLELLKKILILNFFKKLFNYRISKHTKGRIMLPSTVLSLI